MFSITLFNRNIFRVIEHRIMSVDVNGCDYSCPEGIELKRIKQSNSQPKTLKGKIKQKLREKNPHKAPELFEGFRLYDKGIPVAHMWICKRGADVTQYKIRNIEAYAASVFVKPEYRGRGYAVQMLNLVAREMKKEGIGKIHLAVRPDNESAIKAYERAGYKQEYNIKFIRTMKINIPYRSL